jgi:uncharacterized RDD family membrane protein YckC
MKYAAYYKRILSSLIDLAFLYAGLVGIYYFYPQDFEFRFTITVFFFFSILYHFMLYRNKSQTFGEKYLGLKLVFTREVKNKDFYYLVKAFILSTVYFPFFSMREGSIAFILGTLIIQLYSKIRKKKILIWDLFSKTAVIDERASSILEEQSNEEGRASDL